METSRIYSYTNLREVRVAGLAERLQQAQRLIEESSRLLARSRKLREEIARIRALRQRKMVNTPVGNGG